jgi:hypothetical protein
MTTKTYVYSTTLTVTNCGDCGIPFAIPRDLYADRRKDGRSFYCPNGHFISYAETENQRLARELAYQKDRRAAIAAERDQIQASLSATRGVVTRMRNRAIAGECSFCGQHLHDLARHVARMHPNEKAEA